MEVEEPGRASFGGVEGSGIEQIEREHGSGGHKVYRITWGGSSWRGTVGFVNAAFELADRTGRTWSKQDLLGKRAVLHFFRSYCHSCDVEAPAIRALEAASGDDVVWLHVMTDVVLENSPVSALHAVHACTYIHS